MQMEVAVRNAVSTRIKMLTELNDRECIARVGKDGRLLSAFKGKTLDFVPVSKKKITASKKKSSKTKSDEMKKTFSIETKNTLKDMMLKQSASRKRVNFGNS